MVNNNDFFDYNSQAEIDRALINAGLPRNRLNKLLKMVEERLTCDRECERQKKLEEYKKSLEFSKNEYDNLPNKIAKYEKEYYTLDKGEVYYEELIRERYSKAIKDYRDGEIKKLYEVKNELDGSLIDFQTLTNYDKRIKKQYNESLKKNKKLKMQIENKRKKTATDERKVYYEEKELNGLSKIKYYLYILYWSLLPILFLVYIIVGPFFPKKQYKNYLTLITLIIGYVLFAIPPVLRFVVEKLVYFYYKILEFLNF